MVWCRYWTLDVKVLSNEGRPIRLEWDRVRCFDRDVASMFLDSIVEFKRARVVSVEHKEKTRGRPQALNTVELMRNCSAGLGN